uniref:Uncharacterized protein n=1 Tax=Kapraunia schneideri TaxID=717899 RepID=A0A1Z1MSG3_9FLOR|nr:hypothetical protein [Kapraunia schneideri]ARW68896.1 hypothetical protein [Kapraunia schneideri]
MNRHYYNFFLRYIRSQWILQENLFILNKKKQKENKKLSSYKVVYKSFLLQKEYINYKKFNHYKIIINKINKDTTSCFNNIIMKKLNLISHQEYFIYLRFIRKGLLHTTNINCIKKIRQDEYIYLVNQNIMIIVTIAKSFVGTFLGIKVSSYIKKKSSHLPNTKIKRL